MFYLHRFEYRVLGSLLTHTHSLEVTNCWSSVQAESVTDTSDIGPEGVGCLLVPFPMPLSGLLVWFLKTDGFVFSSENVGRLIGQLVGWSDFTPHLCCCPPKRTISSSYLVDVLCSL